MLTQIELATWGTLDRSCGWEAFAAGCSQPGIAERVREFRPDAVLGVDWSSLPAFEALKACLGPDHLNLTYAYLNYRYAFRTP